MNRNILVLHARMLRGHLHQWGTAMDTSASNAHHEPWNKGKIVGQKAPFKLKDIWALRIRLQMEGRARDACAAQPGR